MGKRYIYNSAPNRAKRKRGILALAGFIVVAAAIGATVYLRAYSRPPLYQNITAVSKPVVAPVPGQNYGLPTRVQIPKLTVDTHVIYEGLTKDGNMSVPSNVVDVGWYKYGSLPGINGTAVLAGHLDGLRGEPGVFANLSKLAAGDTILVTESTGLTVSFVVREKRSYPQNEQPAEVFTSKSGSHLNIITCTGSWDKSEHRFAERLVVFADKAS
jgi:sortase (surface protein transpeptidase)